MLSTWMIIFILIRLRDKISQIMRALFRYGENFTDKGDWRRNNVNLLIEKVHKTIREIKPWVKFGISPFAIYRNATTDPLGSRTGSLQNYDDLYADVLFMAS